MINYLTKNKKVLIVFAYLVLFLIACTGWWKYKTALDNNATLRAGLAVNKTRIVEKPVIKYRTETLYTPVIVPGAPRATPPINMITRTVVESSVEGGSESESAPVVVNPGIHHEDIKARDRRFTLAGTYWNTGMKNIGLYYQPFSSGILSGLRAGICAGVQNTHTHDFGTVFGVSLSHDF